MVREIWNRVRNISTAHIVKIQNQGGILPPCAGRGDFRNRITFPKAVTVPEGFQSAFCAYSRSGKNGKPHFLRLGIHER
jgi:hypothetical protein